MCALPVQVYQDFNARLKSFAAKSPMLHYLVCGWTLTGTSALLYRCNSLLLAIHERVPLLIGEQRDCLLPGSCCKPMQLVWPDQPMAESSQSAESTSRSSEQQDPRQGCASAAERWDEMTTRSWLGKR